MIHTFSSPAEEEAAVVTMIQEMLAGMNPEEVVLVARSAALLGRYSGLLLAAGILSSRLEGKGPGGVGVQLSTMHRVKGLEFRAAFIVGCSAGAIPQPYTGDQDDLAARTEHEERERRLLYVAMTRARELLWISGTGTLSPFIETPPSS